MKSQCLYGFVAIYPPHPLDGEHKISIGRKNKCNPYLCCPVCLVLSFFSFLIYLFLKEEGGEGCGFSNRRSIGFYDGGIFGGILRGYTWN